MKHLAVGLVGMILAGCATTGDSTACAGQCAVEARANGLPVPTHRAQPVYPQAAVERGIGGCVVASFEISPQGVADHYQILDSQPPGVFDTATLKALNDWRFEVPSRPGRYAQVIEYRVSPTPKNPPACIRQPGFDELNKPGTR